MILPRFPGPYREQHAGFFIERSGRVMQDAAVLQMPENYSLPVLPHSKVSGRHERPARASWFFSTEQASPNTVLLFEKAPEILHVSPSSEGFGRRSRPAHEVQHAASYRIQS
jgi:hypothetical protein